MKRTFIDSYIHPTQEGQTYKVHLQHIMRSLQEQHPSLQEQHPINTSLMLRWDSIHSLSLVVAGRADIASFAFFGALHFTLNLNSHSIWTWLNVSLSSPSPFHVFKVISCGEIHPLPAPVRDSEFYKITSDPRTRGRLLKCANEGNCACSKQQDSDLNCTHTNTHTHRSRYTQTASPSEWR